MTDRVCFRCDWRGSTASDSCPRCGAPLQGGVTRATEPPRVEDANAPQQAVAQRSRWAVVATLLVIALGLGAVVFVQRHTPPPPVAPSRSALGYLVYAAEDDGGSPRLWVWNLSTSTATPGPPLRAMPIDLLFSYTASSGWVNVTTPTPSGLSQGSVLRALDPSAILDPLGRGQLVAWLSSGGYLSVGTSLPAGGCHARVQIVSSNIATDVRKRSLDTDVCGRMTSLGRDLTQPYFTLEHDGRASIYRVTEDGMVPVLRGYRALSVSLNGDLLVERPGSPGSLYYDYPSPTGKRPARIGDPGTPLYARRVLGWSGDATSAYVLGAMGGIRGIYRIAVSPVVEPRSPDLVLATDATDVSVSTTPTGGFYALTDGTVTLVANGSVRPLSRPDGVPTPVGPLLWISTLPYSRSVAG